MNAGETAAKLRDWLLDDLERKCVHGDGIIEADALDHAAQAALALHQIAKDSWGLDWLEEASREEEAEGELGK